MSSIASLYQRISFLQQSNKNLSNELDEYYRLKSELTALVEAHLSCQKRDRSAMAAANVQPSRCVNSFMNQYGSELHDGSDRAVSGGYSSLTGIITSKQHNIMQKMDNNNAEIKSCYNQISQLQKQAALEAAKNKKEA